MFWRNIPVLCYHNIDGSGDKHGALGHPLEHFEKHLDVIQDLGFKTISAQHLLDICLGKRKLDDKYLVVTFDDCHLSHWLYAVPLLAKRNMTGVFFAVTDFLWEGQKRTFEDAPPLLEASDSFKLAIARRDYSQFMNTAEMAAVIHDYGMEIYAHTSTHQACFRNLRRIGNFSEKAHWTTWAIYPQMNPARESPTAYPVFERGSAYAYNGFWPKFDNNSKLTFKLRSDAERYAFCLQDFRRSFENIKQVNKIDRQLFCWPWGHFDKLSLQALKEVGFVGAFTLERSRTGRGTNPFRLNRILVGRTLNHRWLRNRLRMYSTAPGAYLFFKYYRKKPEVRNVLYLTDSMQLSGGNRQLLNNVAAMSEFGICSYIVLPSDSDIVKELKNTDAHVILWDHFSRYFRSVSFLARIVREHHIDVVHTFHSKPAKKAVFAKLLGGRFRLCLNRGVIYTPNPLIGLFAAIADGVICNSHKCADVLRSYLTPKKKIQVVYNSFSANISQKTPEERDLLRVIYIGNANPVKGHDVFLETAETYMQRYPEDPVKFVSYGIGKNPELASFVSQETLDKMEIHGPVPHEEILQALGQADVFALTSRLESMPNVLLEAFAASLAVVCTDVGGVNELVRDGINGFLCDSEDTQALAEKIHDLVLHPEKRLKMGKINKKIVTHYLNNTHKGYLLLRVYSGERISETIPFQDLKREQCSGFMWT